MRGQNYGQWRPGMPSREAALPVAVLEDAVRRILSRIEPDTAGGCWLWPGCLNPSGYPAVGIQRVPYGAHRVMYTSTVGKIPDGALVLHRCDVRQCCNPAHLFVGAHQDNTDDARRKGRLRSPGVPRDRNHKTKLTMAQVWAVRIEAAQGVPYVRTAERHGLSRQHVRRLALNL